MILPRAVLLQRFLPEAPHEQPGGRKRLSGLVPIYTLRGRFDDLMVISDPGPKQARKEK
jgi:hypothetical protein